MTLATISIPASMIDDVVSGKIKPSITVTNMGTGKQDLTYTLEVEQIFLQIKDHKKS